MIRPLVMLRALTLVLVGTTTLLFGAPAAFALEPNATPTLGRQEGEIDMSSHVDLFFGDRKPTAASLTDQEARDKVLNVGAGYTIGALGPLRDVYVRIEGGYFLSGAETVERTDRGLPFGTVFHPADRGGYVSTLIGATLVDSPGLQLDVFARGTVPINVDIAKFAAPRMHYASGGVALDVDLTAQDRFIHVGMLTRTSIGSGIYSEELQKNASFAADQLLTFEAKRWILPWKMGLRIGPRFEADINSHVDVRYSEALATAQVMTGADEDPISALRLSAAIAPYFRITDNAAIEARYDHQLVGHDTDATQRLSLGVRSAF